MKIQTRSRLILVSMIILFLIILCCIFQPVILERFQNIEQQEMIAHVQRAVTSLNEQQESLAAICEDRASQTILYSILTEAPHQYNPKAASLITPDRHDIDYLLIYNASGSLVYADISEEWADKSGIRELDKIVRNSIIPEGFPIGIRGRYGISVASGNPVILAGYPIIQAGGENTPLGTLVLGRILTSDRLRTLETVLQIPELSLERYSLRIQQSLTPSEEAKLERGGIITRPVGMEHYEGFTVITGIENTPTSLILHISTARPVFRQVQASLLFIAAAVLLFSGIFLVTVQLLLQRYILTPISRLDEEMMRIGGDCNISLRADGIGDEEIVSLKRSLNCMLDEIQQSHEELRASQEALEQQNQQLFELNRKANLYLDIYLDVITYEILNAVMGLRGYAALIKTSSTGQDAIFAEKIESIAAKSGDVIRNIETISQIYKNPPKIHLMHLATIIQNEARFYLNITISMENCDRMVLADDMLGVIFNNLFSNSVKFGGAGVKIQVLVRDIGNTAIQITVADDGPGIPDTMKPVIFDRFTEGSMKRGSYGLGLHIVKMLVTSYGGTIQADDRVEGDPSKGAAIRFSLRIAVE